MNNYKRTHLNIIVNKKYLDTIDETILCCDSNIANSKTATDIYTELIKTKMEKDKKDKLCRAIAALFTELVFTPIIMVLLWNWAIVDIFGIAPINYLHAIALIWISDIIFKGISNRSEIMLANNNKLLYQMLAYDIAKAVANNKNHINNIEE